MIEKESTTPQYYPLTLNALTNACNQKSNRNPVMTLEETTVHRALEQLMDKGYARRIIADDSRVPKYRQLFTEAMGFDEKVGAVVGVLLHTLLTPVDGPLNVTAPDPVRQKDFLRILARSLGRPLFLPTPEFVLKLLLGEFAGEVLSSARVLPRLTEETGYRFRFTQVESALGDLLK